MASELPATTSSVLRLADQRLRLVPPGDVYEMCATIRRSAAALAPIETFYVGLYRGESQLVIPYLFSGGMDLGADTSPYRQGGLSHWIRSSGRPYRHADDQGRLLNRGAPIGDPTPSQDALVVPMMDTDGHTVLGMLNAQSAEPNVFDDQTEQALLWLGRALAISLELTSTSTGRRDLYAEFPELDSSQTATPTDLLLIADERLDTIAAELAELHASIDSIGRDALAQEIHRIRIECLRAAAEMSVLALRTPDAPSALNDSTLTAREQEIATLIATESLSNRAIGQRLQIAENTVKTHVAAILKKLDLRQRSEIVWTLAPDKKR